MKDDEIKVACENIFYAKVFQNAPKMNVRGIEFHPLMFHLVDSTRYMTDALYAHTTLEFSLVERGGIAYKTNERKILLGRGDAFVIPPGVPHTWSVVDRPFVISGFKLSMSKAVKDGGGLNEFYEKLAERVYHLKGFAPFQCAIREFRGEFINPDSYSTERIWCATWRLLIELTRNLSISCEESSLKVDERAKKVEMMKEFVAMNISHPLTLADVGRYVNLSPRHAARIFNEREGKPLGEFILNSKINEAERLLAETDDNVKSIAMDLGFETHYFCRLFKNKTGRTPSEHRSQQTGVL